MNTHKTVLGKCYYFEDTKLNFTDAIDNCKLQFGGSGKLFEPMNLITNNAVANTARLLDTNQYRWIGIHTLPEPALREFHYVSMGPSTPLAFKVVLRKDVSSYGRSSPH